MLKTKQSTYHWGSPYASSWGAMALSPGTCVSLRTVSKECSRIHTESTREQYFFCVTMFWQICQLAMAKIRAGGGWSCGK